jgi:hypothetical protein
MWTQIAGKVRMALCPPINHCWGVALYVTSRGLTTSPMPYQDGSFEITFDFVAHSLEIVTSRGDTRAFQLKPRTVAEFYAELMGALHSLGIEVKVWTMPVEVPRPVRFTRRAVKPLPTGRGYKALQSGVFCCSTYCLMMASGAPPQLAAK